MNKVFANTFGGGAMLCAHLINFIENKDVYITGVYVCIHGMDHRQPKVASLFYM